MEIGVAACTDRRPGSSRPIGGSDGAAAALGLLSRALMSGSIVQLSDLDWEAMGQDPCRGAETRWKLVFSADRTETHSISMGMAEIAPGGVLDLHRHDPPEVYHVVEGQGVVEIDGESHGLAPGVSIFIPGNTKHVARNTGAAPLRFLFVFPTDALSEVEYRFDD